MSEKNWKKNEDGSFTEVKPEPLEVVVKKKVAVFTKQARTTKFKSGSLGFSVGTVSRIDALRRKIQEKET